MKNICLFLFYLTRFAFATQSDNEHALSASGGIASPSFSSAAFQNSAGLVYNSTKKFELHAGTNSSLGNPRVLPGLIFGNGDFAMAAGLAYVFQSKATAIYYGGALALGGRKLSLGVNGFNFISPQTGATLDAGLMFDPFDKSHFGINVVGITSGIREIGFGLETPFSGSTQFVADATVDKSIKNFAIQPGIKAGDPLTAITLSYGFGGAVSRQLTDGFAAGLHLTPGQSVSWEIYYRQLGYYFTSLSFAL